MSFEVLRDLPPPHDARSDPDSAAEHVRSRSSGSAVSYEGTSDSHSTRWSFAPSQYRQSAILEMGSAIPMEIGNATEIQIEDSQRYRNSWSSSTSGVTEFNSETLRDAYQARSSKRTSFIVPITEDESDDDDEVTETNINEPPQERRELGAPWAGPSGIEPNVLHESYIPQLSRQPEYPVGPPPNVTAPLSPLNYPTSITRHRKAYSYSPESTDSMRDSDGFMTAREYSSDEQQSKEDGISSEGSANSKGNTPVDALKTQWVSAADADPEMHSKERRRNQNMVKLEQLINEEEINYPAGRRKQHQSSSSDPPGLVGHHNEHYHHHQHPLPSSPAKAVVSTHDNTGPGELQVDEGNISRNSTNSNLPHELIEELANDETSEHPVRSSSRRRGYDTVAPHLALKGETAILDAESLYIPERNPNHYKRSSESIPYQQEQNHQQVHNHQQEHSQHNKSRHHQEPVAGAEPAKKHTRHSSRRRRNFTKKSMEDMVSAKTPAKYDIEDIGLPAPERRLLEKFIDSLSKLSIEVQLDEGKREEGRRRLNNALRALEGWI